MSDLRKAAEMALEALEWNYGTDLCDIENCMAWLDKMNATIPALRQALAEPANSTTDLVEPKASSQPEQERKWVGVTDEDIKTFQRSCHLEAVGYDTFIKRFAIGLEAKLKEKNGG